MLAPLVREVLALEASMGQLVKTLVDAEREPGFYTLQWDGTDIHGKLVSSGIYVYRMEAPAFAQTRKMLLLK